MRRFHIEDEEIDAATHLFKPGAGGRQCTALELEERVRELVRTGKKHFLIDLSTLTFVDDDSSILVTLARAVESAGCSFALLCPDESVRRIFVITGLGKRLPVYGSRREALAAIGADDR